MINDEIKVHRIGINRTHRRFNRDGKKYERCIDAGQDKQAGCLASQGASPATRPEKHCMVCHKASKCVVRNQVLLKQVQPTKGKGARIIPREMSIPANDPVVYKLFDGFRLIIIVYIGFLSCLQRGGLQ